MTTPPPVSEERLRELVDHNNLLADDCKTSRGTDSVLGEQYRHAAMAMTELAESRTTIAALTKEHDRRGTSVREYMDMCEEYSASVVELTDLLTRVMAEMDVYKAAQEVLVEDFKVVTAERDELKGDLNIARLQRDAKLCSECPRVAEVAELRRDAGRYRWLRDNQTRQAVNRLHADSLEAMRIACELHGDKWDAAIDAQLQPSQVPHE